MERLTHKRVNGIKQGYWTAAKKDELAERLAAYEDTGLTPEEIMDGKMLTGWIPCSERLPEEHDTMFARYLGTDRWSDAMFARCSDNVNVTVEFEDGTRKTVTMHTTDGEWLYEHKILKPKAIAWQPLPEPWEGDKG